MVLQAMDEAWLRREILECRERNAQFTLWASQSSGRQRERFLELARTEQSTAQTLCGIWAVGGEPAISRFPEAKPEKLSQTALQMHITRERELYRGLLGRSADPGYGAVYGVLAGACAGQLQRLLELLGQLVQG